jgi:hypothetical protein
MSRKMWPMYTSFRDCRVQVATVTPMMTRARLRPIRVSVPFAFVLQRMMPAVLPYSSLARIPIVRIAFMNGSLGRGRVSTRWNASLKSVYRQPLGGTRAAVSQGRNSRGACARLWMFTSTRISTRFTFAIRQDVQVSVVMPVQARNRQIFRK